MKSNDILREELARMRQLMGMSGSLYQKPIMEDESKSHGEAEPNPADYKGGESNPEYRTAYEHWREAHQARPPARPPAKPPAKGGPSPAPGPKPPSPPASPPASPPSSSSDKGKGKDVKKRGI